MLKLCTHCPVPSQSSHLPRRIVLSRAVEKLCTRCRGLLRRAICLCRHFTFPFSNIFTFISCQTSQNCPYLSCQNYQVTVVSLEYYKGIHRAECPVCGETIGFRSPQAGFVFAPVVMGVRISSSMLAPLCDGTRKWLGLGFLLGVGMGREAGVFSIDGTGWESNVTPTGWDGTSGSL